MIAITGANGHLGQRLAAQLGSEQVRLVVRSRRALAAITETFGESIDCRVVDYGDRDALATALAGCDVVVHLVGIIKESAVNGFADAHERPCEALSAAAAAAGVSRIVMPGIVGSNVDSPNACLASRGRAEQILLDGSTPVTIVRVPMVLGEGDYAAGALKRQSRRRLVWMFRADSLEQPIYAGDVVNALIAASRVTERHLVLDLAGPESLARRELVARAASASGREPPAVISLPLALGMLLAWCLEKLDRPPVTRAMLGVLDHDDRVDVSRAVSILGLELTPLDEMLARVLTAPVE